VLEGWLPAAALSSLRAADKAGVRSVGIDTAILQLQGGENIVGKLARILAFPYLLSVVMGVYGVYISDKMLSAVEHQAGIGLSVRDAVATFGAPLALLLAAGMVALSIALPRWAHPSRRWSHNWPIFSLYRVSVAASVLHTLGNLTQCGMKLGDALIEAQHRNTPFACWHLRDMQRRAIGQSNLGTILDTGLLLPTELSALKVLGERVSYAELLTRSGDNHQAAVTAGLSRLTTWLPKAALGLTIVLLGSLIMSAAYQLYLSFL
jgi:type II secretory pathway component PulF